MCVNTLVQPCSQPKAQGLSDTAMHNDECRASHTAPAADARPHELGRPSLGLIGFGAFGRLVATHLRPHVRLCAFDVDPRAFDADTSSLSTDLPSAAGCDIVVLATPVNRLEEAIRAVRPYLRHGAIVLDVGSVKLRPAEIMRRELPDHVSVVGTHPLFGPQSARHGIAGLKIAVCPIRGDVAWRIAAFLRAILKLRVFVTTPDRHDREAAMVQGLTHLIAKVLTSMEPWPTAMTTVSFDRMIEATEMVRHDAPEVFMAIERENPHAEAVRRRFFALATELEGSF
jgi:prephenate dehydrogenase